MINSKMLVLAACAVISGLGVNSAFAVDIMGKRDSVETIQKDIAKDKDKISKKKTEISSAQAKLDRDLKQFGNDSVEARDAKETLMRMRNELVELRADLYKDTNKLKVSQGQPIENEATS